MRDFLKKLAVRSFAAAVVTVASAPFALAITDAQQAVHFSSLSPPEQHQAFATPVGNIGPQGQPADAGCFWSRIQVPGAQGLEWIAIETCNSGN